jgi:23S rRNA (cytidine2498-2'-O)-methyltransferase
MRQVQSFYRSLSPRESVLFVAPEDHRERLLAELKAESWSLGEVFGRFVWAQAPDEISSRPLVWAVDAWRNPKRLRWNDQVDLASLVREALVQDPGASQDLDCFRWVDLSTRRFENSQSLLTNLRSLSKNPRLTVKWAQIRADEAILSTQTLWPWGFLRGEPRLRPKAAPSDAISKLLEAFEMVGYPQKGDRVVDLGASPGSWTYAALLSGAQVFACDRSPLELQSWPQDFIQRVQFRSGNAFAWGFSQCNPDWVLSDLICTPEKLWKSLEKWIQECPQAKFVCTLKFKGDEGLEWIPRFQDVPGATVLHLQNNQNEACFLKRPECGD